ncbi:DUF3667 domain-containing protein [Erythrobacter alti]|uniref:DUF3667 domain-containing protein n=1 Tax=Erythrobacter alti TaxID=1896145 RepID=UPI0030F38763
MSDLLEGIGTASEGGLLSRALEPDSGAKAPHPDQPEACLNCGTALTGAYCHACGQSGHVHRTIGAFMHDLLHGALHFEGKLWRTLPMLIFRPGKLTRRYIEGERARFVSPMALFLFGVFLMFAVFQMVGLTAPTDLSAPEISPQSVTDAREGLEQEREEARVELEALPADSSERAELEAQITTIDESLGALDTVSELNPDGFMRDGEWNITGVSAIDDGVIAKWRENPGLMLYKLQANAYKFSWLLIPISIPFVWLMFFWKRRFKAYDHAIFVTYSLSFMTLLFITGSLLIAGGVDSDIVVVAAMIITPIHMYKHLRYTYEIRRFSALCRLLLLSVFIWIVILLFLQVLLVLGAF